MEAAGLLPGAGGEVALAGDLRPSTPRILGAVARAVADGGHAPRYCGTIPAPAVALQGLTAGCPALMVTGSHIPDDRNGIKFNSPRGEILKADEAAIRACEVTLPADTFDAGGALLHPVTLPEPDPEALQAYIARYLDFHGSGALEGLHLGLYTHSSVIREAGRAVLEGLGARVTELGRSARFVPVDTEAIRPEDAQLAMDWSAEHGFDAIVSADGDADRPLLADEHGCWLRGDVAGALCAGFLGARTVVTPVSSNTVVERWGRFARVVRTRIGSPFVIEAMQAASAAGEGPVVGYEANGGFLVNDPIQRQGRTLAPLPTRDPLVVVATILAEARRRGVGVSALTAELPGRYTASERLQEYPVEASRALLAALDPRAHGNGPLEARFGDLCDQVSAVDHTDGLRVTFRGGDVVHLRPSGNAPELRCYAESDSAQRARELSRAVLERIAGA
jgi:phosphomannomutase